MKIKLFLLIFFYFQFANALTIENVTVSQIDGNNIRIHLKTYSGSLTYYNNHFIAIDGNNVTLTVCYDVTSLSTISWPENDFDIALDNSNYTLTIIVNPIGVNQSCSFQELISNVQSFDLNLPISGTITLALQNDFKTANLKIFPNPTCGPLSILSEKNINSIRVHDGIGRKILNLITNEYSSFDLSNLSNGIYYLNLEIENINYSEKLIIQK